MLLHVHFGCDHWRRNTTTAAYFIGDEDNARNVHKNKRVPVDAHATRVSSATSLKLTFTSQ